MSRDNLTKKYDVIFTNGCFDILHRGHLELLKYCASIGNRVIVGLNSDVSVKILKGPLRPINSADDREAMLMAIHYVDEVRVFDEETPYELIRTIRPDIIVKGGDYTSSSVVGNDMCKVKIFNFIKGYSTSGIISSIKR